MIAITKNTIVLHKLEKNGGLTIIGFMSSGFW